jgi:hypothetical protein
MHPDRSNPLKRGRSTRRGYALTLVLVFVVLMLAMLGIAWRGVASALRLETVRKTQIERDEGSVHAVALAMRLLETGVPPSVPYMCGVTLNTSNGAKSYTVTFAGEGENLWSVHSAPTAAGETPTPMPDTFAPTYP